MKVVIIGAGYVGLTTGACLAELGHHVLCIDIDEARIAAIKSRKLPVYEPDLENLVARNLDCNRLAFSHAIGSNISDAELVFLAVGTPSRADGDIDLSYVETAARNVAPHLGEQAAVVIKSTVTAGTAKYIRDLIVRIRGDRAIDVASNPEFLREGSAVRDFMKPDRIVIGADRNASQVKLVELYAAFERRGVPVLKTTTINAELIKYAANAFLALKIGFINQVADLCEGAEADVVAVSEGMGLDSRIGRAFLSPGPGYGGSCFPKDTRAFAAIGRRYGQPQSLVETLIGDNELRKTNLADRILEELGNPEGGRVTILGTAFKANTDDMREAAALAIVPKLIEAGVEVRAHDPKARFQASRLLPDVLWYDCPYEASDASDAIVILTEWEDYRRLDLSRLAGAMRGDCLIDYRNLLTSDDVVAHGLHYVSIGRPKALARTRPRKQGSGVSARIKIAASPS
ncbi:UDP-glucose 6-dehydrogenase [Limoniibacter endophyticus]|uniref:UDP-glucose 6-dehydrogenase n=2 Tax=Limoniibacter endophyticus TaxID=1565040 RepID=A0A8J3GH39_9HYPH|nr:UDP-glucose 6-dehydrogenase [Limoniibacter endophyticus]